MDQRFRAADIGGLSSREFEVDLLAGERLFGEPMRVRLTKTMSTFSRVLRIVLTCGLYEVWQRCFAAGTRVFDVDARLALTSRGRLLLWTHTATGGSVTLLSYCCKAAQRPVGFIFVAFYTLFFVFAPAFLGPGTEDLAFCATIAFSVGVVFAVAQWLFQRASVVTSTSVRQFDVRELSLVRLVCYSRQPLFGWGGEVICCQVRLFFGVYPRPAEIARALPSPVHDSGSVNAFFNVAQAADKPRDKVDMQTAAGMGTDETTGFVGASSSILLMLAFASFLNEALDFVLQLAGCAIRGGGLSKVFACTTARVSNWWTGSSGETLATVLSHWIDTADWSLQLVLFLYVAGPAIAVLWDTMSSSSSGAGIGFIVDRRRGTQTEDERFEEHWLELADFLAEIFGRACLPIAEDTRRALDAAGLGRAFPHGWDEIDGDALREPSANAPAADAGISGEGASGGARPPQEGAATPGNRASWAQVGEATSRLLDPISGHVRVYKAVLAWSEGERVLAVYPERVAMGILTMVKIALTCGLEYACRWRTQRREGALILTDRRLLQVNAFSGPRLRALKVDMFMVSPVKYMAMHPSRDACCTRPRTRVVVATRCGLLEVELRRVRSLRRSAQALWQGFALLQAAPSIQSVELDDWASVVTEDAEAPSDGGREAANEAMERVSDLWGESAQARLRDAVALGAATGVESAPAAAAAVANPRRRVATPLLFDARTEAWGLSITDGERILWGPTHFEQEVLRPWCCACRRRAPLLRRPSALVALTDRRLAVISFEHTGPMWCWRFCGRTHIASVAVVPLCFVLGFCIEEAFSVQRSFAARFLGKLCCEALSESALVVRVLTNAGLGKNYIKTLQVRQRSLPRSSEAACTFEEDKILELRRWLGNVALHFSQGPPPRVEPDRSAAAGRQPGPSAEVDLWRCARGWAPA